MRNISINSIKPVIPTYSGNSSISFGTTGSIISANDGVSLYYSDLSSKYRDIKMNRNTLVHLVSDVDIGEFISDEQKPNNIISNSVIYMCSGTDGLNRAALAIDDEDGVYVTTDLLDENIAYITMLKNEDDTYSFVPGASIIEAISISPNTITCLNAGTTAVNIIYTPTDSVSGIYPTYTNSTYSIRFVTSGEYWGIFNASSLLYINYTPGSYIPQKYNWVVSGGNSPAPTLDYDIPTSGNIIPILRRNWVDSISQDYQKYKLSTSTSGWYTLKDINDNDLYINYNNVQYNYFAFSENGTDLIDVVPIDINGLSKTNNYVRYENIYKPDYSSTPSVLEPNTSISGVSLNYIMTSPYHNIEVSGDVAYIQTDIIPLKNYKHINSDQMMLSSNAATLRTYDRVYMGGNQLGGYQDIHLGYKTDYGVILPLKPDTYTYFHMPLISETQYLSAANLERSGAVSGPVPAYSDRIFKKKADYKDYIWWGGDSDEVNSGTWLCAWLSGTESPVWMERYYNPGKITYAAAMETTGAISNDFTPNTPEVRDVVSNMKLTAGSYYKYFHIGSGTLASLLNNIYGTTSEDIIIKYTQFKNNQIVVDDSNHADAIILNGQNLALFPLELTSDVTTKTAVLLNDATIKAEPSQYFQVSADKSVLSWIFMDDWKNTNNKNKSCAIHSNYFNGGDKLEYIDHGLYYSSIIPYSSQTSGFKAAILNAQTPLNFILSGDIPTTLSATSYAVDLDGYLWCAGSDASNTQIYKMTADGTVFKNAELNYPVSKFIILNDNIGYAVSGTNSTVEYYPINLHTLELSGTSFSGSKYSYVTSGSNGPVLETASWYTDIFEDLTLVQLRTTTSITVGSLSTTAPTGCSIQHICCDSDSTIFATTLSGGYYNLYSIDRDTLLWSEVGDAVSSGTYGVPKVFLTKEIFNATKQDILYWLVPTAETLQISKYYKNNVTNTYEQITGSTLTLPMTYNLLVNDSDFSGYKLNKVYSAIRGQVPVLKYSVITDTETDIIKTSVETPTSGLPDNWHHIVTSKRNNDLSMYIDGALTNTTLVSGNIIVSPEAAYCIGSDIIKTDAFFDVFGDTTGLFNGGVAEFIAIKNGLLDLNISTFYSSYFINTATMEWPIRTSPREFIENIKTLYKFKIPGMKSQFYNIVVKDSGISESERDTYESAIRERAKRTMPDYVQLKDIIWKDYE